MAQDKDLGLQLFKIKVFEKLGDFPQIEVAAAEIDRALPRNLPFANNSSGSISISIDRMMPRKQLRAIAAADPKNSAAELDVVRFCSRPKGRRRRGQSLLPASAAGGDVFPYQMALAEFDFAQGNNADSFKLLETLASDTSSPEHALAAKIRLAELNLDRKNIDAAEALVAEILQHR